MADEIIAARVRELLHYDPSTGVFTRKIRLAQRHNVDDRADFLITGGNNEGYCRVSFDSKRYLAHRVAWIYVHGKWPELDIDHINGNKSDNRLENLRAVNRTTNLENLRKPKGENTASGFLGVTVRNKHRYVAKIQVNKKSIHIGIFDTATEAHAAYLVVKRKLHKGCTI